MTWKERLLASASASTLKIKGITKKLKNKVILLRCLNSAAVLGLRATGLWEDLDVAAAPLGWLTRVFGRLHPFAIAHVTREQRSQSLGTIGLCHDVVVPSSLNPPPPPTYHSAATPATPTPFANLPPPTKHEFSSQRIVCIRDLGLALDEEDAQKSGRLFAKEDEDGDVAPHLMSPAWPHRKHLSTLPEESDGLTSHLSDEEDDAPQPDVYVQAVLMPVENLGMPTRGGIVSCPCPNSGCFVDPDHVSRPAFSGWE
ncbi:hypothetical protein FRC00_008806 [Tulasnella sp. 408]|nr:hypothetical protein FRC00_008806 [Tulasnella sp. 408]